ncbi:MAG: hypothetical protein AAGD35_10290 [Actinomycetota bacterium]
MGDTDAEKQLALVLERGGRAANELDLAAKHLREAIAPLYPLPEHRATYKELGRIAERMESTASDLRIEINNEAETSVKALTKVGSTLATAATVLLSTIGGTAGGVIGAEAWDQLRSSTDTLAAAEHEIDGPFPMMRARFVFLEGGDAGHLARAASSAIYGLDAFDSTVQPSVRTELLDGGRVDVFVDFALERREYGDDSFRALERQLRLLTLDTERAVSEVVLAFADQEE